MNDHDDLTDRLGDLGSAPVPAEARDRHLHAMRSAVPSPEQPRRFGRVAVAAAAFVGFAVGSTGFAMAGALPDPAQGVAHDVLSVVQVDVPDRPDAAAHGECMSTAAKIADPTEKKAAQDECKAAHRAGKGERGRSEDAPGRTGEVPGRPAEAGPHPNADTEDCKGKPPWAGKGRPSAAEKEAFFQRCPERGGDDAGEAEAEALEDQREAEVEALERQREADAEAREQEQAEVQPEPRPEPVLPEPGPEEVPPAEPPAEDPAADPEASDGG